MTIKQIIYGELPYLKSPDADVIIDNEAALSFYALQTALRKSDAEVLDEDAYKPLEKMLVAYYASYKLANKKARENTAGAQAQDPEAKRYTKRTKASTLEIEYAAPSGENALILSAEGLLSGLKNNVCEAAANLGVSLPMCGCAQDSVDIDFFVYEI